MCNYSDGFTTATFDPSTGDFSFDTTDAVLFGTGVIPIVITGSVGNPSSEQSITFDLRTFEPALPTPPSPPTTPTIPAASPAEATPPVQGTTCSSTSQVTEIGPGVLKKEISYNINSQPHLDLYFLKQSEVQTRDTGGNFPCLYIVRSNGESLDQLDFINYN